VQTLALRRQAPPGLARRHELADVPFFPQTEHHCGPAALATVLRHIGLDVSPAQLAEPLYLPARTGTLQVEMLAGARRQGSVATRIPPTLDAALREVQAGHPVLVLQNLGLSWAPLWHYAVLVGHDLDRGEVLLRSGTTRREVLAMSTFEHTWQRSGGWAFVALPPGDWPGTAQEAAVVEAAVGHERVAPPRVAVLVYRSALQRWPANLSLAMGLGNSLHAAGDLGAAAQAFEAAADRHDSAAAWVNLASTRLDQGQADAALQAAQRAVGRKDPAFAVAAAEVLARARTALARPGASPIVPR